MKNTIINQGLQLWGKHIDIIKTVDDVKFSTQTLKYFYELHDLFSNSFIQFNKIKRGIVIKRDNYLNSHLPSSLYKSYFISSQVKKNIERRIKYKYYTQLKIRDKLINVCFYSYNEIASIDIREKVKNIYILLNVIMSKMIYKCSDIINIHIVLTDEKKELQEDKSLNINNINSAVTESCSEDYRENSILIYREEEWIKVFIHELFHLLGLDFSLYMEDKHKKYAMKHLKHNSNFNLFETYCEIQATLIHSAYISYLLSYKHIDKVYDMDEYIYYVKIIVTYEMIFSIFQTIKILDQTGTLNFTGIYIYDTTNYVNYHESISIYSYHILKSLMLLNINDFMRWIYIHNFNILQFDRFNIYNFIKFVVDLHVKDNNDILLIDILNSYDDAKRENKQIFKTMRMTINDML